MMMNNGITCDGGDAHGSPSWFAGQLEAVRRHRAGQQAAWVQRHQCTAGRAVGEPDTCVQLGEVGFRDRSIGLVLLVNEAANYQWSQGGWRTVRERAAQAGGEAPAALRWAYQQLWEQPREFVVSSAETHYAQRARLAMDKFEKREQREAAEEMMKATSIEEITRMLSVYRLFSTAKTAEQFPMININSNSNSSIDGSQQQQQHTQCE